MRHLIIKLRWTGEPVPMASIMLDGSSAFLWRLYTLNYELSIVALTHYVHACIKWSYVHFKGYEKFSFAVVALSMQWHLLTT